MRFKSNNIFRLLLILCLLLTMAVPAWADSVPVSASSDDAYEDTGDGSVCDVGSVDLLCDPNKMLMPDFDVGMRFQNVLIPPGATVDSAEIVFQAAIDDSDSATVVAISRNAYSNAGGAIIKRVIPYSYTT